MSIKLEDDKLKECRIVFEMFDKDKDGSITTSELGDVLRVLGAAPSQIELEEIIRSLESSSSGMLVSFEAMIYLLQKQLVKQDGEEEIVKEFAKLDNEGNGKIKESQLRDWMSNYDNAWTSSEIEEVIQEANVDNEGYIDYVRFTKILLGKI